MSIATRPSTDVTRPTVIANGCSWGCPTAAICSPIRTCSGAIRTTSAPSNGAANRRTATLRTTSRPMTVASTRCSPKSSAISAAFSTTFQAVYAVSESTRKALPRAFDAQRTTSTLAIAPRTSSKRSAKSWAGAIVVVEVSETACGAAERIVVAVVVGAVESTTTAVVVDACVSAGWRFDRAIRMPTTTLTPNTATAKTASRTAVLASIGRTSIVPNVGEARPVQLQVGGAPQPE